MAKRKQRNYRAEQAHKRNLEQAEIRRKKKQQKEFNDMMDNLAVGDEVTLKCGLIGEIVSIREETITVVTSKDKTKVRFLKTAVMTVDVKASEK